MHCSRARATAPAAALPLNCHSHLLYKETTCFNQQTLLRHASVSNRSVKRKRCRWQCTHCAHLRCTAIDWSKRRLGMQQLHSTKIVTSMSVRVMHSCLPCQTTPQIPQILADTCLADDLMRHQPASCSSPLLSSPRQVRSVEAKRSRILCAVRRHHNSYGCALRSSIWAPAHPGRSRWLGQMLAI